MTFLRDLVSLTAIVQQTGVIERKKKTLITFTLSSSYQGVATSGSNCIRYMLVGQANIHLQLQTRPNDSKFENGVCT